MGYWETLDAKDGPTWFAFGMAMEKWIRDSQTATVANFFTIPIQTRSYDPTGVLVSIQR